MQTLQAPGAALQFVVALRATGTAIGTCLLFRHEASSQRAELGYVLGHAHWGQGFMAEALNALIGWAFSPLPVGGLALRRLEAEVDPRNLASAALLGRLGFAAEGLLRQRWVNKGVPIDVTAFGLLSHEWASGLSSSGLSNSGPSNSGEEAAATVKTAGSMSPAK
jgi:[ribosomal protein S5]-alanine N-acetyltransferase